jgi:hypothetical protein
MFPDCVVEQDRLLGNEANDTRAQLSDVDRLDVTSVDPDGTTLRRIQAHQETSQRRLSRTAAPDDRGHAAAWHVKIHAEQDRAKRVVGEVQVLDMYRRRFRAHAAISRRDVRREDGVSRHRLGEKVEQRIQTTDGAREISRGRPQGFKGLHHLKHVHGGQHEAAERDQVLLDGSGSDVQAGRHGTREND